MMMLSKSNNTLNNSLKTFIKKFVIALLVLPLSDSAENNNLVRVQKFSLELTQAWNIQRQEHIQDMCKILGYDTKSIKQISAEQMDHLLIDTQHKFLYCYVPKIACTNWKRMLMILTEKWTNSTDPLEIPATLAHSSGMFRKLNSLSQSEQNEVLHNYTRFIIARHPFERLLSAYRNKLEGDSPSAKYFQSRIGRHIISNIRINPTNTSLEYGNDVTFKEFILYLLTPELSKLNQTFNEHWEPITNLCHPCTINYNIIGKYETLVDDSALTLSIIDSNKNLTFPTGHKSSGTKSQLKPYFDSIPVHLIKKLYEVYRDDFKLFDYDLEYVLGIEFP